MLRSTFLLLYLIGACLSTHGQCVVSMNSTTHQVVTTCNSYPLTGQAATGPDPNGRQVAAPNPSYSQKVYLGSEFFTFPTVQDGRVQVDDAGKEIACQVAYNVVTQEVLITLEGNSKPTIMTPESFMVNNTRFVRRTIKTGSGTKRLYCMILKTGPTQLLMAMNRYLSTSPGDGNGYAPDGRYNGVYMTKNNYFIQKGEARPEQVSLSKKDLLTILYEYADQIDNQLPNEKLTTDDVRSSLQLYDSLIVANSATKLPLNTDAVFNQAVRERITYPSQAWNKGVYGRVYVGFEIDRNGKVVNVTLLSPGNGGYGFEHAATQSVRKLPVLKPDYAGAYVLPIAFTLTNRTNGNQPNLPFNTLPTDRLGDRLVLDEIKIPITVSKPIAIGHEVWGTYK